MYSLSRSFHKTTHILWRYKQRKGFDLGNRWCSWLMVGTENKALYQNSLGKGNGKLESVFFLDLKYHSYTHTLWHSHIPEHAHTHIYSHTRIFLNILTYIHTYSHTHMLPYSYSHTPILLYSQSHVLPYILSHSHNHINRNYTGIRSTDKQ